MANVLRRWLVGLGIAGVMSVCWYVQGCGSRQLQSSQVTFYLGHSPFFNRSLRSLVADMDLLWKHEKDLSVRWQGRAYEGGIFVYVDLSTGKVYGLQSHFDTRTVGLCDIGRATLHGQKVEVEFPSGTAFEYWPGGPDMSAWLEVVIPTPPHTVLTYPMDKPE